MVVDGGEMINECIAKRFQLINDKSLFCTIRFSVC